MSGSLEEKEIPYEHKPTGVSISKAVPHDTIHNYLYKLTMMQQTYNVQQLSNRLQLKTIICSWAPHELLLGL